MLDKRGDDMITLSSKGSFNKTFNFFEKAANVINFSLLDKYGKEGVAALVAATPKDTGKTASSWTYEIVKEAGSASIVFKNSNIVDGNCIAILLQYGHGTRNGGFVVGRDYINPAIQPIFDKIAKEAWKEVTS